MDKEVLKEYLSKKYQGAKSFLEEVIFPIFGEENFSDGYETDLLEESSGADAHKNKLAKETGIRSIKLIGEVAIGVEPLQIFDITVTDRVKMERNRVSIQRLIREMMEHYSCAFMLFHYEDETRWDWRFTYCYKSGKKEKSTDSKRYTFLLGQGQSCRTAADNFMGLYNKREALEIQDIEEAFSVEALSKEFFGKYKDQYDRFVGYMADPANGMRQDFIDPDLVSTVKSTNSEREEKPIRDYVKKLLGRIVFLHFLQKKGWLGVPATAEWGAGKHDFMLQLYNRASETQKNNFLDEVLEKLFTEGLDSDRSKQGDLFDTGVEGFRECRIPYLNGGLFEQDELDQKSAHFPATYFKELLEMFAQYNFTIDENDPNDAEVGVDPEMLGRIFENLLEDNKDKGAFYTPKEIVQYMCRESLIAYLQTDQREEDKGCIRQFVITHDAEPLGKMKEDIDQKLIDVKICDPAIGSGAFPMGLLRELFFCRSAIEPNIVENAAKVKRHIIENNIYGVDIERGAVDIARLRFWLSLIVDEKSPEALPNLDFKIMQGNSLLEQYKGADLSNVTERKFGAGQGITIFDHMIDIFRKNLRDKLAEYYICPKHDDKVRLRKDIADIVKLQLEEQGINIDFGDIDLSANSQFFLWHTWFYDVFSRPSQEGFDIVIGNPPYIQLQKDGGELADRYANAGYTTFARTGDIYCLFYERGWQLLRDGGHLCYITSNKWMRAAYGEKTRAFFAQKTNPMLLIDFAGVKIFESATVDTNILLLSKEKNQEKTICTVTNKQQKSDVTKLSDFVEQQSVTCAFTSSDSWVILSPIEQSIKNKIEAVGTPLKEWDIKINYGIKTGCNEAFIITTAKRNEILDNCGTEERQKTEELIRPILRGKDIKRYGYDWAGLWLIYLPWHFPYQFNDNIQGASEVAEKAFAEQYPSVYAHMLQYKEILSKRNRAETGIRYEWYALQRWGAKYWDLFFKPYICWKAVGRNLSFALVEGGTFLTAPASFISAGEYNNTILLYLRSSVGKYFIYKYSDTTGAGDIMLNIQSLIQFPIPIVKVENENMSESEIDTLVFDSYGLTKSEISYIKDQLY